MDVRMRTYVVTVAALAAALVSGRVAAAAADTTASFSVAAPTEVPGAVLKPGQYTIQVVDHLSDRSIVRLDSTSGSTHVTFLGVNATAVSSEPAHPVEWPEKAQGKHALRGFAFPGGRTVEFVYPKADAVALANANGTGVVAIDPASEGRPELSKLTNTDMQMVNLWMLTPVRVGPGAAQKGIEAKRYQPAAPVVAAVTAPAPPRPAAPSAMMPRVSPRVAPPTPTVARVEAPARPIVPVHRAKPVVSQLPKTAGDMSLVWMAGLLSFAGAGVMRWQRSRQA